MRTILLLVVLSTIACSVVPPKRPASEPRTILWKKDVKNAYPRVSNDGSGQVQLTRGDANNNFPYWSPDGAHVLFNSTRGGEKLQVFRMDAAGAGVARLFKSDDDDSCARISPRGDRLVYLANLATGQDDVIVRDADGSNARQVTFPENGDFDARPSLSPDGRVVVFNRERGTKTIGILSVALQ